MSKIMDQLQEINKDALAKGFSSWLSIKYLAESYKDGFIGVWTNVDDEIKKQAFEAFEEYRNIELRNAMHKAKCTNIPEKYIDKSCTEDFIKIKSIIDKKNFMIISGDIGSGSTSTACIFCADYAREEGTINYISSIELQSVCDKDIWKNEDVDFLTWAKTCKFLCLDDVGRELVRYNNDLIPVIINYRLDNDLKTLVVLSNSSMNTDFKRRYAKLIAWNERGLVGFFEKK